MKYGSVPALNEYIAMKAMFNYFGQDFELPVPLNDAMLKFGEAHSPEYACFPFKLYLGYLKQLAEKGVTDLFVHGLCDIRSCRYVDLWEGTMQIVRENGIPKPRCITGAATAWISLLISYRLSWADRPNKRCCSASWFSV